MAVKRLFFLVPYINQNTTSINRFNSFINEASNNNNLEVFILYFDFSDFDVMSIGIDGVVKNDFSLPKESIIILEPHLNFLQKLAFKFSKAGYNKTFKLITLFHQLIYLCDIFSVNKIKMQLDFLNLKEDDTVIALGGPFGLFKTVYEINKLYESKYVLDYRDPWTYGYPPIDGSFLFHYFKKVIIRQQENKILSKAQLVSIVSESLRNFLPSKFLSKVVVIPNAGNYLNVHIQKRPNNFNILYLGTVYNIQLIDHTFFKILSKWIIGKTNVNIIFLGAKNTHALKNLIEDYRLTKYTLITNRLEKDLVQSHLENASIFLHLKYGDRKEIITSKQADYLTFRKPILLPVSDNGDIAESIIKNKAGYVCNQEEDILKVLDKLYSKFLNGSVEVIEENESYKINNREYWAEKFIDLALTPPNS